MMLMSERNSPVKTWWHTTNNHRARTAAANARKAFLTLRGENIQLRRAADGDIMRRLHLRQTDGCGI